MNKEAFEGEGIRIIYNKRGQNEKYYPAQLMCW